MNDKSALYYECHVTLEPPDDTMTQALNILSTEHGFRVASFEMRQDGDPAKSFTSARDESYSRICVRAKAFCESLKKNNFVVLRCKVEDTLLDTKHQEDIWGFLS